MKHQVLLGAPYSGQTPSRTTTKPTAAAARAMTSRARAQP